MRLEGKTALVTGAASGLGAAAALRFQAEGCRVCFCDIQQREGEALAAFQRYGRELSEAVMIALYAYDPDALIFGGSISAAFDLFERGLREGLEKFAYPRVVERLVIDRSELDNAAVLGAAALYVDSTR